MKPEKQRLIHDLLDEQPDARRQDVLLAGGRILRWRRRRRIAMQVFAAVAILGIAALSVERMRTPQPRMVSVAPTPAPAVHQEGLTDEELLALFPKTPVGLAKLANGKKRLIFPRPGDEERLITRL